MDYDNDDGKVSVSGIHYPVVYKAKQYIHLYSLVTIQNPPNRTFRATPSGSGKRTSLSLSIYMPASSGLGKPPSRTILLHYVSFWTDPLLSTLSTTDYSHVLLTDLYTLQHKKHFKLE